MYGWLVMDDGRRLIDGFDGAHMFLSNFWRFARNRSIEVDGITFRTVEAAYQAMKTLEPAIRLEISKMRPGAAKRYGTHEVVLREDWDDQKIQIMHTILRKKFLPGTWEAKALLRTDDALLVEGNGWGDKFWGVCGGIGENHLGKLLMKVREEIGGVGDVRGPLDFISSSAVKPQRTMAVGRSTEMKNAVCPRCGHGVEHFPCWQCGYPNELKP